MDKSKQHRSILNILLVRIIILLVLISAVLACLQINETVKLQRERDNVERQMIMNEAVSLMAGWNSVIQSAENIFNPVINNIIQTLRIKPENELSGADLTAEAEELGFDPGNVDLYILENGICINTTDPDADMKSFLSETGVQDSLPVKRLTMEGNSKRFRCFGYQVSVDRKYIIAASCYSEKADELINRFKQDLKKASGENTRILSADLYFPEDNLHRSLLNDNYQPVFKDSLISLAMKEKVHTTKSYTLNDRTLIADYLFIDPVVSSDIVSGPFVLSVISDNTESGVVLLNIIKKQLIIILAFLAVISLILFLMTRKLKLTLKDFLKKTALIADGALHERVAVSGRHEFTALAEEFNNMVEKLEASQNELKKKNRLIESKNKELQDQNDEILAQRDQIQLQRDEIELQKNVLSAQKDQILEQSKDITDSIQYARRIQSAILPHDEVIKYLIPKHFIYYRPRNIVSGDFYWLTHKRGEIIFVVADCTGHGVPGALMSMLGSTLLSDAINGLETLKADLILNELRDQVILRLRQTGQASETKDGMDIGICLLNKETMKLQFAGAYNPLYMIRNGKLTEIKADRMPIGISSKAGKPFKNNEIKVKKDDTFYLFTDGILDQFGGEKGKKLLSTHFKELLLRIQDKIMYDQKEILENELNEWMGLTGKYSQKYEQVDDIIIMGIKI